MPREVMQLTPPLGWEAMVLGPCLNQPALAITSISLLSTTKLRILAFTHSHMNFMWSLWNCGYENLEMHRDYTPTFQKC